MGLAPGARIGPYEVTALIGEGGMGKIGGRVAAGSTVEGFDRGRRASAIRD
jgi:hypothetical protein